MTYKYNKEKEWIGFCDICNQPFEPLVVDASVYVVKNRMKEHYKMDLTKKKSMHGYCVACCKVDGKAGFFIVQNIKEKKLYVRKVGKVSVV